VCVCVCVCVEGGWRGISECTHVHVFLCSLVCVCARARLCRIGVAEYELCLCCVYAVSTLCLNHIHLARALSLARSLSFAPYRFSTLLHPVAYSFLPDGKEHNLHHTHTHTYNTHTHTHEHGSGNGGFVAYLHVVCVFSTFCIFFVLNMNRGVEFVVIHEQGFRV